MYFKPSERIRFTMAAGFAVTCGIALAGAIPMPKAVTDPRYELVLIDAAGESYVMDYDLTLSDCVNRWADFPGFTLACERAPRR